MKGTELQAIKSELTQIKANVEALLSRLEQITEDTHIAATGDRHTQKHTHTHAQTMYFDILKHYVMLDDAWKSILLSFFHYFVIY